MQPAEKREINTSTQLLIVIAGTSASGKDTVIKALVASGLPVYSTVNVTNRPIRPDQEREGHDYFFVDDAKFLSMVENGDFFEYSNVYGDMKGVLRSEIFKGLDMGGDVIARVDVQGAAKIRAICPDAVLVFLSTSDQNEQYQRLVKRASETGKSLETRLATAVKEMEHIPEFDYHVINHENHLDDTVAMMTAIIRAEHLRANPRHICVK